MLGTIVGHHIEVVLHDLTQPERSIVAIANGHVSNRRVGSSILSGPKDDKGFVAAKAALTAGGEAVHSIVDDYPTLTRSGQRLKSSTVVFRDAAGQPFAALCLNADLTIVEATHAWLGRLLHPHGESAPARDDEPAMDALMKEYAANEDPSIVNLVAWNVHAAGEYLRRAASDDERPAREHWNRLALLRLDGADRAIRELTFQVTDTEDAAKLLELATRAAALRVSTSAVSVP